MEFTIYNLQFAIAGTDTADSVAQLQIANRKLQI
jgi:hypothetical protein